VIRIDSPTNPRLRGAVTALREGDLVAVVGARAITEALADGIRLLDVFFEEGSLDEALLAALSDSGAELIGASERVVSRLSGLPSARGAVALASPRRWRLPDLPFPEEALVLLLDSVQDPTNVGAILRSAEAFGAAAVVLTRGTADPFSPKALRASAGSAFRIPVAADVPAAEALSWARSAGARVAGAEAKGGKDPGDIRAGTRLLLAIGSEGHGLSSEVAAALDERVTIPLRGRVESLNAAVAAALLLYTLSPKTSASNR
jgi:TrmH family RNA methyltransferase